MKVARISPDRTIEVVQIAEPATAPNTVKIRVERCGICGTDLVARTSPNPRWAVGSVLGHEIVGTVAEVGEGVEGWAAGDRVALYHGSPCPTLHSRTALFEAFRCLAQLHWSPKSG